MTDPTIEQVVERINARAEKREAEQHDRNLRVLQLIRDNCDQFESCGFDEVGMADLCRWFDIAKPYFAKAGCDISDMDVESVQSIFGEWMLGKHAEVFSR